MPERTTHVVMNGQHPITVADDLATAQTAAITADTKYTPADRKREHRWDPADWAADSLVLKTKSLSTGRWVQTGYTVVPVPHTP